MTILILGNGGREHALAWKLNAFSHEVFVHPGNAGTIKEGFPSFGTLTSPKEIASVAKEKNIALIIIGPEQLLAEDYASTFRNLGFWVVGPGREAAKLETSKIFSKEFMVKAGVPTADFTVYDNLDSFQRDLISFTYPTVLKLDGLAAGKGVTIAKSKEQAIAFADNVWVRQSFGPLPQRVLVEEFIAGVELSYLGFCDGNTFLPLSSSTDFKRVFDSDEGPNTGGMGAVSPSPHLTLELEAKITTTIVAPILNTLLQEKIDFRGILYIGIMIDKNKTPFVLEFNTRFGDPETQSLLMRLDTDLLPSLMATAKGELANAPNLKWREETAIYVVAATAGYPENPVLGSEITGLEAMGHDTQVFFGGVAASSQGLVTSGGRVLGVGALGCTISEAREKAYRRLKQISWKGMHYRTDIGLCIKIPGPE